jgi:hypothetical protein
MRSDTKKSSSLIEALSNVAIGYGISFTANALILPQFGYDITISDNLCIGGIFTLVSVARSYVIRRLFLGIWIVKDRAAAKTAAVTHVDPDDSLVEDFMDDGVNEIETSIDFDELDYLLTDGPCAGQVVPSNYSGSTIYIPYVAAESNPDLYTSADGMEPNPMKVALYTRESIKMGRNVDDEHITTRWSEWKHSPTPDKPVADSYFAE